MTYLKIPTICNKEYLLTRLSINLYENKGTCLLPAYLSHIFIKITGHINYFITFSSATPNLVYCA